MSKQIVSIAEREVWCVEIRQDHAPQLDTPNAPWMEVNAEYVERWPDGSRHVRVGLPALRAEIANLSDHNVTLGDGHKTTMGTLIEAIMRESSSAVDAVEQIDHQGRPQCLRKCMDKLKTPPPKKEK